MQRSSWRKGTDASDDYYALLGIETDITWASTTPSKRTGRWTSSTTRARTTS